MPKAQLVKATGRLAPGVYVTSSNQPAYAQAMAMITRGVYKLRGLKQMRRGVQVITYRVPGGVAVRRNPSDDVRQITMGPEFFQTAMKDYENWREKWWREAVQNSVDAGATRVDLRAVKQEDGTYLVSCEDNGGGMTEEVLVDKFLVLGGSTKKDASGATGGFGKAKELLLLPWIEWEVHTRDVLARGSGNHYRVSKTTLIKGTKLTVRMAADQYTYEAPAKAFLAKCSLPAVKFYVNGELTKTGIKGTRLVRSFPGLFDVYFAEGSSHYSAYVRSNGIYMFDVYIGDVPGMVFAELTGRSVDLLTANRDSFRNRQAKSDLSTYVNELAKDTRSALREKKGMFRKEYQGTGRFRVDLDEQAAEARALIGPIPSSDSGSISLDTGRVREVAEQIEQFRRDDEKSPDPMGSPLPTRGVVEAMLETNMRGPAQVEAAMQQLVWRPDFMVDNNAEGFKVPAKFLPEKMTPTVLKLAKVWTELCRYVLIQLACSQEFGVGFVFDKSRAAQYLRDGHKHWLMLNPLKDYRSMTGLYRVSEDYDLKYLYALAVHECTHMADGISYHDEDFASALTHNIAICADGYRKIKRIVSEIKTRGGGDE